MISRPTLWMFSSLTTNRSTAKTTLTLRTIQLFSCAIFCLSACAGTVSNVVPEPTRITVSEALNDVATGLINMTNSLEDSGVTIGFFPCKAIVAMNITAGGLDNRDLVINASASPAPGLQNVLLAASAGATFDMSSIATAARGNTILFEMYNPACIPNNTLGYDKPDKIKEAAEAIWKVGTVGPNR